MCGARYCGAVSSSALIPLICSHWTPLSFSSLHFPALLRIRGHLLHPLMVSTSTLVAAAPSAPLSPEVMKPRPSRCKGELPLLQRKNAGTVKTRGCPHRGGSWLPLRQERAPSGIFLFLRIRSTPPSFFLQTGLPLTRTEPDDRLGIGY